jgi:CheY-like chemotaxis protein
MKLNYTSPGIPFPLPLASACRQQRLSDMCVFASLLEQVRKEVAERADAATGKTASGSGILVMLADDDSDDREQLEEVITGIHTAIQVLAVEDGLQLMNKLTNGVQPLPAILFLDLNMPGKSGKQCLVEIKNNPRLREIPVVIYSTSSNRRDIQDTHSNGASLYVPKPNSFKGLIAVMARVFSLDLDQLKVTPPLNQFVLSPDL